MNDLPTDEDELLSWFSLVDRADLPIPTLAQRVVDLDTIEDEGERTRARRKLGDRLIEMVRAAVRPSGAT